MITDIYLDDEYNLCSSSGGVNFVTEGFVATENYKLVPTEIRINNLQFFDSYTLDGLLTNPTYTKYSIDFILKYEKMKNIRLIIEYGLDGNYTSEELNGAEELLAEIDKFYLKKFDAGINGVPVDFFNVKVRFTDPVAFSESLKLFPNKKEVYGYDKIIEFSIDNYHKVLPEISKFLSKLLLRNNLI